MYFRHHSRARECRSGVSHKTFMTLPRKFRTFPAHFASRSRITRVRRNFFTWPLIIFCHVDNLVLVPSLDSRARAHSPPHSKLCNVRAFAAKRDYSRLVSYLHGEYEFRFVSGETQDQLLADWATAKRAVEVVYQTVCLPRNVSLKEPS